MLMEQDGTQTAGFKTSFQITTSRAKFSRNRNSRERTPQLMSTVSFAELKLQDGARTVSYVCVDKVLLL